MTTPNARDAHTSGPPAVRTLGALLSDPSLTDPPHALVPDLVYAGRVTLLSGREKSGKSTLVGQAAAALSCGGSFLGATLEPARVLWLPLDEPRGDLVRRVERHGADHDAFLVADDRPASAAQLGAMVHACGARVVVVDTLSDLWAGFVSEEKDAGETANFLRPYARLARETGVGLVLLHHLPKTQGTMYRGSTAIGATVDILATLTPIRVGDEPGDEPADDDGRRILRVKGRADVSATVSLSFDGERYARGHAPLPLRDRVLRSLRDEPATASELAEILGKRKGDVLQEVRTLKAQGLITQTRGNGPFILTVAGAATLGTEPGTGTGTGAGLLSRPSQRPRAPLGTGAEPRGNSLGTAAGTGARPATSSPVPTTLALPLSREPARDRWAVLDRYTRGQVAEVFADDEPSARREAEHAGFGLASHRVQLLERGAA